MDDIALNSGRNRDYARGLTRAAAGAIIFGLPLLMTMEMWSLGHSMHPVRLMLFLALNVAVLVFLSRFGGFEPTMTLKEDVLDAFGAYAVGIVASIAVLSLFGLITVSMPVMEIATMIAVQSVPSSFGAMLARKQLGEGEADTNGERSARTEGYAAQLFLMMAGALFFAFNIAPTEEVLLIGFKMTAWHSLALVGVSLLMLHALVFTLGFPGRESPPEGYGTARVFLAYTVPGYGVALLVCLYVLWTFGRLDGMSFDVLAGSMVVLGFPASIGAAIARLIV